MSGKVDYQLGEVRAIHEFFYGILYRFDEHGAVVVDEPPDLEPLFGEPVAKHVRTRGGCTEGEQVMWSVNTYDHRRSRQRGSILCQRPPGGQCPDEGRAER